ncbi:MAG: hypothetical protein L7S64_08370, partial [Longimicrobiales bacterium]|nr:hypothetical protein [Longimicrobiales bacterium]
RRSAMDCVSAGLRSWASSQVQNEVRVQSYRTRARGLTAPGGLQDDDGDGAPTAPGGPSPAKARKAQKKGGGKGKPGRGQM